MTRQQRRKMERDMKKKTTVIQINWKQPDIIKQEVKENQLYLDLKFKKMKWSVIISRVGENDFVYEDPGMFKRTFDSVDSMLWEFELPRKLRGTISSLPIREKSSKTYLNLKDMMELLPEMYDLVSN